MFGLRRFLLAFLFMTPGILEIRNFKDDVSFGMCFLDRVFLRSLYLEALSYAMSYEMSMP